MADMRINRKWGYLFEDNTPRNKVNVKSVLTSLSWTSSMIKWDMLSRDKNGRDDVGGGSSSSGCPVGRSRPQTNIRSSTPTVQ
jgi:hypothetical protein